MIVVLQSLSHARLFGPRGMAGSCVYGILRARILEWVAFSSSRDLPDPAIELASPASPALAGGFFTASATWEANSLYGW